MFALPRMHPKWERCQTNPKVALTVDTDTQPPHVLLVQGTASVEIVDGISVEYPEASKKYIPVQQWQAFEVQVRGLYKQMARIKLLALISAGRVAVSTRLTQVALMTMTS